ncbi:MAG TPA: trehalose-6-phosphate synthase [Gemmatimonadaceae bacterium]|jgi:trehalose 6-phosphate synthase/phosphatase
MPDDATPVKREFPLGRLITVSNRLPVTVANDHGAIVVKHSVGGLATGLRALRSDDASLWVGWPGNLADFNDDQRRAATAELQTLGTVPIELSPEEISVFYEEISNAILWPLCHDRIDQLPLHMRGWDVYESINQRYADAVAALWKPGDVIWVHDYQLFRAPLLLRRLLPRARIGFFLHVPFPNPEIFFTLPVRRWLVEGMLGADLIGFHTRRYRGHFTGALRRLFGIELNASVNTFAHEGRRVALGVFPMGIDAQDFAQRASTRAVSRLTLELREKPSRVIVGIDRLDYSKGIQRRLMALEQLFVRHPQWRGKVRFIQVAVPSRGRVGAYRQLRRDVEALVGRINGEFGTPTWTPINYIYRSVSPTMLSALYRAADVMLVTPVRDGMNLVAKEFVASRGDEDGVLVLSEFAGAADELGDASIVNPYDVDGVAEAIHEALMMSGVDRRHRMRLLRAQVFAHDVHRWAEGFLAGLCDVGAP